MAVVYPLVLRTATGSSVEPTEMIGLEVSKPPTNVYRLVLGCGKSGVVAALGDGR
jgi:hypothetical protein